MASVLQFSNFASLPYSVQEHIVYLIDHNDTYLALTIASRYLSELCARSLYESLQFSVSSVGKKRWPEEEGFIQINNVRCLQNIYIQTLLAKPELASFTQQLSWDISDERVCRPASELPIKSVWSAFEQLTAVHTLDLKVNVASYAPPPPTPLFPNLVKVRVNGTFPQNTLEQILHTSPYIKDLSIAYGTKEYLHQRGSIHAYGSGIGNFLTSSIQKHALSRLRKLDVGFESGMKPELVMEFVQLSDATIEELKIDYSFGEPFTAFENWVVPMVQSGRWRRLRTITLPSIIVPENAVAQLQVHCSALASVFRA